MISNDVTCTIVEVDNNIEVNEPDEYDPKNFVYTGSDELIQFVKKLFILQHNVILFQQIDPISVYDKCEIMD